MNRMTRRIVLLDKEGREADLEVLDGFIQLFEKGAKEESEISTILIPLAAHLFERWRGSRGEKAPQTTPQEMMDCIMFLTLGMAFADWLGQSDLVPAVREERISREQIIKTGRDVIQSSLDTMEQIEAHGREILCRLLDLDPAQFENVEFEDLPARVADTLETRENEDG